MRARTAENTAASPTIRETHLPTLSQGVALERSTLPRHRAARQALPLTPFSRAKRMSEKRCLFRPHPFAYDERYKR